MALGRLARVRQLAGVLGEDLGDGVFVAVFVFVIFVVIVIFVGERSVMLLLLGSMNGRRRSFGGGDGGRVSLR